MIRRIVNINYVNYVDIIITTLVHKTNVHQISITMYDIITKVSVNDTTVILMQELWITVRMESYHASKIWINGPPQ